jgi:hypothetical protein
MDEPVNKTTTSAKNQGFVANVMFYKTEVLDKGAYNCQTGQNNMRKGSALSSPRGGLGYEHELVEGDLRSALCDRCPFFRRLKSRIKSIGHLQRQNSHMRFVRPRLSDIRGPGTAGKLDLSVTALARPAEPRDLP